MNLMKTYIYNLMKCFLIALFIFTAFRGESVLGYDKLFAGESEENIKVSKIKEGFNISVENDLEEGGHTTAYFSPSLRENVEKYGGFSFHVENKSEGEVKMNFIINETSRNYKLEEDDIVLALEDGENTLRRLKVSNGVFELEENFRGNIYIPFTVLGDKTFKTIESWGLTLTCRNGEDKNFNITNLSYMDKEDAKKYSSLVKVNLKGDLEVPVPSVGEAIVDYEIDRDAEFFLKDSYEGVSISEEGHLVVNSQAEAGKVNVFVAMAEGEEFCFNIELSERLTKNLKGVTNKSLASPSLDEVVNKNSFINNFLLNEKVLFIFRCIITLIVLLAGGVYLSWRGHFHKLTKDKLED